MNSKEDTLLKMDLLRIIIFAYCGLFSSEVKAYGSVDSCRDVRRCRGVKGLSNDVANLRNELKQWRAEAKREFQGKVIVYNSCNLK